MVRHLDDAQRGERHPRRQPPLHRPPDVPGQPERRVPPVQLEDDRVVVAHALALPVGGLRVEDGDVHAIHHEAIAGPDTPPAQPARGRLGAQARKRLEWRNRDALPGLARPELVDDGVGAADVIGIAVREDEIIEPPDAGQAQHRRHHAVADVERRRRRGARRAHQTSGISQHRGAAGKPDERRIALPDVDKRHVEPAVPAGSRERPRLGEHPERRRGRDYDGGCSELVRGSRPGTRGSSGVPPHTPGSHDGRVVDRNDRPGRWRDAKRGGRHEVNQVRRPHKPRGAEVREETGGARKRRPDQRHRHGNHAGDLGHRHQRNRQKVKRQAGERHAREEDRADGKQRRLGRNRCRKHRSDKRYQSRHSGGALEGERGDHRENRQRGAKGENERGIDGRKRLRAGQARRDKRERVERRAAEIGGAGRKGDHRHQRRPIDRRAAADEVAVGAKHDNRRDHRAPAEHADKSESGQHQPREDRDVAAGNRQHVVRAGFLQASLHLIVQPGTVADDDGQDDRGGLLAPAADGVADGAPGKRSRRCHLLVEPVPGREHLDEGAALRASDERDAAQLQRPLAIRHPIVEIPRGAMQFDGQAYAAPRSPLPCARRPQRAADGDEEATVDVPGRGPDRQRLNAIEREIQRDARRPRRRVRSQLTLDERERRGIDRQNAAACLRVGPLSACDLVEGGSERRRVRPMPRVGREQRASRRKADHHKCDQPAIAACPPRSRCTRGRADHERVADGMREARCDQPERGTGKKSDRGDGSSNLHNPSNVQDS